MDHHTFNEIIVKDQFQISTVDELLDELHVANIFSKLDLRSRYLLIYMNEFNLDKTAPHERHYEFLLTPPFSLTNAPATFKVL